MGLHPLEFSDCLTDSPYFRETLHAHEKELEKTSKAIKSLINECKDLLNAAKTLSKAQRSFSNTLMDFKFGSIGGQQTDDELVIAGSLKEFGRLISAIEDERNRMLDGAYTMFIHPLENFRKEQIGGAKEGKKKFDKQTAKFCQSLERYLNLKSKTNDNQLQEADAALEMERRHFYQASMQYVLLLQEVQERKKFEFVETLLGFMYSWLTFYHQGYDVSKDFKPYMTDLQHRLQKTRDAFATTREEAQTLMNKMLEVRGTKPQDHTPAKSITREGYLYMLEKKALGTTWTKHYCQYQKQNKILTMIPYNQVTGKGINTETMVLTSCTRRASESIDKRFCFDITVQDRPLGLTLQALSEEDRRTWLDAMDGKEPIYNAPASTTELDSLLDDIGFSFIKKCITAIESRGLSEQGLYRVGGVNSKVTRLTVMGLDRRKADKVILEEPGDWEIKTITSALKSYFRNLPEPLMTFKLHEQFIQAAKQESKTLRMNDIHTLVHQLPEPNFEMLHVLIKHLRNVADNSEKNLMTVANIGVCFGPTLMRPQEETMAAIMDIKFCNIIVEILVENCEKIFTTPPDGMDITQVKVTTPLSKPSVTETVANNTNVAMVTTEYNRADTIPSPSPSPTSKTSDSSLYPNVSSNQTYAQYRARLRHVGGIYGQYSPTEQREPHSSNSSSSDSISSKSSTNNQSSNYVSNAIASAEKRASAVTSTYANIPNAASPATPSHFNQSAPPVTNRPDISGSSTGSQASLTSACSGAQPASQGTPGRRKVRTLYACEAENDSELSFEPNQIIINVKPSKEPGWLEGSLNGKSGLIPANYVEFLN